MVSYPRILETPEMFGIRDQERCDRMYNRRWLFRNEVFSSISMFQNMSLTEPDGLTAILEKELEFVPKLKISYFEPQNYTWCSDFPMEDYRCLCGEN